MAISRDLNNFVINKVENEEVYDYMVRNNLINNNELYLVQGAEDEKIIVDDFLSLTSENPVQNKVIKSKFDSIESNIDGLASTSYVDTAISNAIGNAIAASY